MAHLPNILFKIVKIAFNAKQVNNEALTLREMSCPRPER